jgi:hypothetical protein
MFYSETLKSYRNRPVSPFPEVTGRQACIYVKINEIVSSLQDFFGVSSGLERYFCAMCVKESGYKKCPSEKAEFLRILPEKFEPPFMFFTEIVGNSLPVGYEFIFGEQVPQWRYPGDLPQIFQCR